MVARRAVCADIDGTVDFLFFFFGEFAGVVGAVVVGVFHFFIGVVIGFAGSFGVDVFVASVAEHFAAALHKEGDVVVAQLEAGVARAGGEGEPVGGAVVEMEAEIEFAPPAVARIGDMVEFEIGGDIVQLFAVFAAVEVGKFVAGAQFFVLVVG